jgi:hypothetical protein
MFSRSSGSKLASLSLIEAMNQIGIDIRQNKTRSVSEDSSHGLYKTR